MTLVRNEIAADLAALAADAHRHAKDHLLAALPSTAHEAEGDEIDPIDPIDYILRPLPRELVERIVFGTDWARRFDQLSRLASPEALAGIVASGIANGLKHRQIAAQLRPVVQGVQSSARRIARTEGMRVAHEVQIQTWEQIPDLIIAYRIHATLDENTRPEHRARDGTVYHRQPLDGQKGFDEMPRPPMEADGKVAHNCRCFLTPIFDEGEVAKLRGRR
jgi:SPP1 gp7 family putative phage head morphogenesis protein